MFCVYHDLYYIDYIPIFQQNLENTKIIVKVFNLLLQKMYDILSQTSADLAFLLISSAMLHLHSIQP